MGAKTNRLKRRCRELEASKQSFLTRWHRERREKDGLITSVQILERQCERQRATLDRLAFIDRLPQERDIWRVSSSLSAHEIERLRGSHEQLTRYIEHVAAQMLHQFFERR